MGTVLGRYLSRRLEFQQVSTVRFAFGLIAAAAALPILGDKAFSSAHDSLFIALLAVVHFWMQSKLEIWEPTIMAGITQCIMLSLSMVVIASLIGAGQARSRPLDQTIRANWRVIARAALKIARIAP